MQLNFGYSQSPGPSDDACAITVGHYSPLTDSVQMCQFHVHLFARVCTSRSLLIPPGCYNKVPQTVWLTTEHFLFFGMETRHPNTRLFLGLSFLPSLQGKMLHVSSSCH